MVWVLFKGVALKLINSWHLPEVLEYRIVDLIWDLLNGNLHLNKIPMGLFFFFFFLTNYGYKISLKWFWCQLLSSTKGGGGGRGNIIKTDHPGNSES